MDYKQKNLPWIMFKLQGRDFCLNSKYVSEIMIPPPITVIPDNAPYLMGCIYKEKELFSIIDLRVLLGMASLKQEIKDFDSMKDKHIAWINELEHCVKENNEFQLPVDPHKCAFGQWFYQFKTDNNSINFILKQIEHPHARLHECAIEIKKYQEKQEKEKIQQALKEANEICYKKIIPLLDQLINTYHEVNKGIIFIFHDKKNKFGLFVDEITNLVPYENAVIEKNDINLMRNSENCRFIKNIISFHSKLFFEIDPFIINCITYK